METIQNTFTQWLSYTSQPEFWWQLAILVLAVVTALIIRNMMKHSGGTAADEGEGQSRLRKMSRKGLNRIQFPISMLMVTLIGQAILNHQEMVTPLLAIATPLLLSLAGIRIAAYILRKGFSPSPLLKSWENIIATMVWLMVALHLLGWLPGVLVALDGLAFSLGTSRVSLLLVLKLILTIGIFWMLALWLARLIEQRLSRSVHFSESSRVALAKFSKFMLLGIAILVALDAAGVDLTALTVFSGAVGVGIGFGLQRISSNFISGFILLFDKSIKPGDVITIGTKFGWVQELRARYIVVRDRDGVETLIPNENLVTTDVINWSYSDKAVRLKLPVQISYNDDPEQAMQIMLDCAFSSPRVLREPVPLCRLMQFADSGIALELRIWIQDPENGLGGVRSEVNLAIWRAFKQAGITIPYPQRDIHIKSGGTFNTVESAD
ncbi:MAG: mechanosensitive ion channel protein MscS [Zetaproteobacteria bacterium CG12_big_fil_rev_8_21_14_0_65_55_1124]|nr:MAG: mechanosensitive ion channel protein MscS [Zetaproteobacteria bacterium CG08_land_8_20_14_0_20_55_17]PIW41941.1 MAG: mechanosensitive ion channel protein MscS [Zetaproteobacteria bacterium CG12_big_fil_rev_8_21_14_0_65_55_1124]PIY53560.1 MAG: mechanosensitive ion channel protein MscS [Zetaproteobacteria bacterium CG_4_10_14_0_8_um_filter_55_43]PIZ37429.1 MAG: mechanosensitive ion channel protein MscS [Zetaproteobacteria bacterium CG_4_10_14_0_2_um_filter_55_20]PJB81637.1 MAG: mechanosen